MPPRSVRQSPRIQKTRASVALLPRANKLPSGSSGWRICEQRTGETLQPQALAENLMSPHSPLLSRQIVGRPLVARLRRFSALCTGRMARHALPHGSRLPRRLLPQALEPRTQEFQDRGSLLHEPVKPEQLAPNVQARGCHAVLPNPSLERTLSGKAPWPRGGGGLSSASRPRRPASAVRSAQTLGLN